MKSITQVYCECPKCDWDGTVGDAEADDEGCPTCPLCSARVVVEDDGTLSEGVKA